MRIVEYKYKMLNIYIYFVEPKYNLLNMNVQVVEFCNIWLTITNCISLFAEVICIYY